MLNSHLTQQEPSYNHVMKLPQSSPTDWPVLLCIGMYTEVLNLYLWLPPILDILTQQGPPYNHVMKIPQSSPTDWPVIL